MKKTIGFILVCLATAFAASTAFAQTQPAAAQDPQCTPENKLAWYNEFRKVFKDDTARANDLAKKWLACPQAEGEEQITPYLKNFVTLYEKAARKGQIHNLVYVKNDYPKAIELARQVLADEPDNLKVLIDFSYAGYASKNEAFKNETLTNAKKAIQLIESGKTLENWTPYTTKEEALGYLYNSIGSLNVQSNPADTLPTLIKAAQFEGKIKTLPYTYGTIAAAYEAGPYLKMSEEYKRDHEGKEETPQSKLLRENINQIIDRMIDAYARAVALAGNDPQFADAKKVWMESLSTWYKFRNNQTDAGLNEMIAGILAKPLPPVPTPITSLPASTPASTPASGNNNATGSNPGGSLASGAAPSAQPTTTAKPATETAKPANTQKPAPAPSKPRTKRNHRTW